jgi:hypothetical protein
MYEVGRLWPSVGAWPCLPYGPGVPCGTCLSCTCTCCLRRMTKKATAAMAMMAITAPTAAPMIVVLLAADGVVSMPGVVEPTEGEDGTGPVDGVTGEGEREGVGTGVGTGLGVSSAGDDLEGAAALMQVGAWASVVVPRHLTHLRWKCSAAG